MKDDSARKALPDTVDLESPEDPAKLQDNTDKEPATLSDREDWHSKLPVTGDQTGKWWYSAFHNVTAVVGAGVLGLPYAMKFLTWSGGVILLVLAWATSLYTLGQLCALHEHDGKRFCRYHELGEHVFGKRVGAVIVLFPQLIVMVGLGIVYSVTGGASLSRIYHLYTVEGDTAMGLSAWIVIFVICQLLLSQLRNFNDLKYISFSAAVMSLGYSTIAIGVTIHNGKQPGTVYNLDFLPSMSARVLSAFNSLGIIAFAYGGHNVILEIQACMPSPPATFTPYMRGVYIAYAVVTWAYFGVAFTGYWAYGSNVESNILFSLEHPKGVIALASAMVFVHVLGSFQVYTVPIFDMIETRILKSGYNNGFFVRLVYRSLYVALIGFVAITIPFFGDLLGFIGAFGTGPTTFWIPPLMWLIVKKPKWTSVHFWASWFCLIFGIVVTILGSIGGMRGIITSASGYRFYQ